jgi:membrane protein required for colicin V production
MLDIILSILLLLGLVRGFTNGFIHEIAVLGTMFVCYFFGFKIASIAAVYLNKLITVDPSTMRIASLFVAWIGISIGIFFLAKLFESLIKITALGIFNKIAGAIFGLIKYALVISLMLYFLNKVSFDAKWINTDAKAKSYLYYKVLKLAGWVVK